MMRMDRMPDRVTATVYEVCGLQAKMLIFKQVKERRRKGTLKRLIAEVRRLRRELRARTSPDEGTP